MKRDLLTMSIRAQAIDDAVEPVRAFYEREKDIPAAEAIVKRSIAEWIQQEVEGIESNLVEMLTDTTSPEIADFQKILKGNVDREADKRSKDKTQSTLFDLSPNKYNGFVVPSRSKIESLVIYLTYRKKKINATTLNKLLFYSDFSFYAGAGRSITGAEYKKLDHGPMYAGYEDVLRGLEKQGRIKWKKYKTKSGVTANEISLAKDYDAEESSLSASETRLVDWVVDSYGKLPTEEIRKQSHLERAWYEPVFFETLTYEHAADLNLKPPSELFRKTKT